MSTVTETRAAIEGEDFSRVAFTSDALQLLRKLWGIHGPLMFHQSGGCCDGSSPMCYPAGEFRTGGSDILLGVLTLAVPGSRRLWQVQILLVLVYTFIIAFRLPEFLTHPFGPIVKNAPILAILWLLAELAPRRRS